MRKCLVLVNNTGIGGAERRFARAFLHLSRQDPHLYLAVNEGLADRLRQAGIALGGNLLILPEGAQARPFYLRKADYARWWAPLRRFIDREEIGLVHAVLGGVYVAFPLFWRKGIRSVISVVSLDLRLTIGSCWGYPLYRLALRRCDRIDALSEAIQQALSQQKLDGAKVRVAPCSFTDLSGYRPAPQKRDWVVFAGRFVPEKNPLLFLGAIPRVLSAFPEAFFLLLGEGPLQKEIEGEIDRRGLRGKVRVAFLPDVGPVLAESKVFVSLQKHNNYPSQSLLEAMACGNAVVATNRGETGRLVTPEIGLLIEEDEAALALAVIALLRDEPTRRAMGERARERIEQEYRLERFSEYLASLYRQLS